MILEKSVADDLKLPPMHEIQRSWTDEFGSLIATLEGRSGGRNLMVIAKLEDAEMTLQTLQEISSFKGRILFTVLENFHAAPLEAVLKANQPNIVVALENTCHGIAISGAGIRLEAGQFTSSTGATYLETGQYNAWESKSLGQQLQATLKHPSIVASIASSLKIPCAVCNFEHLKNLLEKLLV